jgi:hypothetical protein
MKYINSSYPAGFLQEEITCSIEKWRSGLGTIGSNDVTAKYKEGKWPITKEGMRIS